MMSKDDNNPSFVRFHPVANKSNVGQDSAIARFLATGNIIGARVICTGVCISLLETGLLR